MNPESRTCQSCKQQFTIEPDDFAFYEKIKVPPPTFCWQCRMQRRMAWRNERTLYKRTCELTGKSVISCFAPDSGVHVYERDAWWSDAWDPLRYGRAYDFEKPFFAQFKELLGAVPLPSVFNSRCVNTGYANHSGEQKNGYLVFASWGGEDLMYSDKIINSKDSLDLLASGDSTLCYEVINSTKMYKTAFAMDCENCNDSSFLYGCRGCSNCFGCTNLRNKSYYIFNEPYSKEDYRKKLESFDLGSEKGIERAKAEFERMKSSSLRRFANIFNSQNATGDNLSNVSNCKVSFDFREDAKDVKFCVNGGAKIEDSYDGYGVGANSELIYESVDTGADGARFFFDIFVWTGGNVQYSYACHGCENVFGCIGLRKQRYCILNKQYSPEEYRALLPKIIAQMQRLPYSDAKGRTYAYGEFFPVELSPFAYNETIAQEYCPLNKEDALRLGFRWREPEARHYPISVQAENLPDRIRDVPDSIVNEVIECEHAGPPAGGCAHSCTTAFRIVPQELQFYQRLNLPLPRLCPNCRHYGRLAQRNPLKLWHRKCQCAGKKSEKDIYANTVGHFHGAEHCPNEFETSYAPDQPEIVYCEQCYNSEIA